MDQPDGLCCESPWLALALYALIGCVNHYVRDFIGALELPLESMLSEAQYSILTSVYFMPNLLTPLLAGWLVHRFGPAPCLRCFGAVASVGSLLMLVSACLTSFGLLVGGRVLAGVVYEPLLSPLRAARSC